MIDHTGIGVSDVATAAVFYDAALGALGLRRVTQMPQNTGADGIGYGTDYPVFWIDRFPRWALLICWITAPEYWGWSQARFL